VSKNPIDEGDFHGFLPVAVNSNKNLKKRLFVFLLVEKIDKEWYTIK